LNHSASIEARRTDLRYRPQTPFICVHLWFPFLSAFLRRRCGSRAARNEEQQMHAARPLAATNGADRGVETSKYSTQMHADQKG
jgi:hypothetical protein